MGITIRSRSRMVLIPFLMYQVQVVVASIPVFSLVLSQKVLVLRVVLSGATSVLDAVTLVVIRGKSVCRERS